MLEDGNLLAAFRLQRSCPNYPRCFCHWSHWRGRCCSVGAGVSSTLVGASQGAAYSLKFAWMHIRADCLKVRVTTCYGSHYCHRHRLAGSLNNAVPESITKDKFLVEGRVRVG
jgi:hypothetical protein